MDVENLKRDLRENDQEHVLKHWDTLSEEDQLALYHDLRSIDFAEINRYFEKTTSEAKANEKKDEKLQPSLQNTLKRYWSSKFKQSEYLEGERPASDQRRKSCCVAPCWWTGNAFGSQLSEGNVWCRPTFTQNSVPAASWKNLKVARAGLWTDGKEGHSSVVRKLCSRPI